MFCNSDQLSLCDSMHPKLDSDPDEKVFNSDAFYNTLWLLVLLLILMMCITLFALFKFGRIPPLDKRPSES